MATRDAALPRRIWPLILIRLDEICCAGKRVDSQARKTRKAT